MQLQASICPCGPVTDGISAPALHVRPPRLGFRAIPRLEVAQTLSCLCAHTGIFRCSAFHSGRSIPLCGRCLHERLWRTSSSADRRGTCDASRNAPDNSSQPRRRPYVQPSNGPVQRISLRSPLPNTPCPAVAMFAPLAFLANLASEAMLIVASPAQRPLDSAALQRHDRFYDVQVSRDNFLDAYSYSSLLPLSQAHRGGRGNTVENTLPSFAW